MNGFLVVSRLSVILTLMRIITNFPFFSFSFSLFVCVLKHLFRHSSVTFCFFIFFFWWEISLLHPFHSVDNSNNNDNANGIHIPFVIEMHSIHYIKCARILMMPFVIIFNYPVNSFTSCYFSKPNSTFNLIRSYIFVFYFFSHSHSLLWDTTIFWFVFDGLKDPIEKVLQKFD